MKTLNDLALNLCYEIEKLPASDQQTKISIMASDLQRIINSHPAKADCQHKWINAQDNDLNQYKVCVKCNQEVEAAPKEPCQHEWKQWNPLEKNFCYKCGTEMKSKYLEAKEQFTCAKCAEVTTTPHNHECKEQPSGLEQLAAIVHDAYVQHDISMGKSKDVHVPYEKLSEHWKEYDRVTVRAVLDAIGPKQEKQPSLHTLNWEITKIFEELRIDYGVEEPLLDKLSELIKDIEYGKQPSLRPLDGVAMRTEIMDLELNQEAVKALGETYAVGCLKIEIVERLLKRFATPTITQSEIDDVLRTHGGDKVEEWLLHEISVAMFKLLGAKQ